MNIKNAVDANRFHNQLLPDRITYEKEAFDSIQIGNLTDMGYFLKSVSSIGRVNAVMILPDNRKAGGADKEEIIPLLAIESFVVQYFLLNCMKIIFIKINKLILLTIEFSRFIIIKNSNCI